MRTIRASEISTYLYCKRAWWYQSQGYTTTNQAEIVKGIESHYRHGVKVILNNAIRLLAYLLLLLAFILFSIYITQQIL